MNSGTLTLKRIFEQERRLVVPLFQRPYVWKQDEQWEPLWNDIEAVANAVLSETKVKPAKPHFLGAVVLDDVVTPTGHLDLRLIVDGQQRLTTLQLLLEAFHDYCVGAKLESHAKGIRKLTRNDDPMSTDPEDVFKVWPTLVDQAHFRRIMEAESPTALKADYKVADTAELVGHPLADAYLFFHARVSEWMGNTETDLIVRANGLYSTLREKLRLVVIDLESDDDAQVIFESLNARGTPLLPADLVKNLLFHRLRSEGGDIEKVYEREWRHFDGEDNFWRTEQGRGHARRARIDLFLQNFLSARKTSEVPTAHLYTAFRDFVDDGGDATTHLQSIRRYAGIYRSFEDLPPKSREAQFFARIRTLEMASAYPFVLEMFARFGTARDQLIGALVDVESFIVRRMACGLNTRGYNRIFVELLKSLPLEPESLIPQLRAALVRNTAASNRWPDDKEFSAAWKERPTYMVLNQARIRLILEALEQNLRTSKTEPITIHETLTIEHLLPQNWQEHWNLPAEEDKEIATERRQLRLHNIGNLTLLTRALNPAVSNGPWNEKRPAILSHSALNLNRPLPEVWCEAGIGTRADVLLNGALNIWPHPGSATVK